MNLKLPLVVDISHWKIVTNFLAISPRPVLMLTKATECYPGTPFNNITDPTFVPYFTGMKAAGIARGAYHFFRKGYDALKQAKHFADVVGPYINKNDVLVLDVEEGGEKASQLWAWFAYVRSVFPENLYLLYSRKELLDQIVMTQSEKDYFRQIPVWTAGYPYFPDLFSSVPFWYTPDQTKYGHVWLWQYTDNGTVTGISGSVDCNWIDPVFYELIKNLDDGDNPSNDVPPPSPTGETNMSTATTIYTDTRVRPDHNTGTVELAFIHTAGTVIDVQEVFTATVELKKTDGTIFQYIGDKWLLTTYNGFSGWVAWIHKGQPYCKNVSIVDDPDPQPEPTPDPEPTTKIITVIVKEDGYQDASVTVTQVPV